VPLAGQALDAAAVVPGRRGAARGPARGLARGSGRRAEQIAAATLGAGRRRREHVAGRTAAEQRLPGSRGSARAIGTVATGRRHDTGREEVTAHRTAADAHLLGDERGELRNRGELHPVGETLLPGVGVPLDLAALDLGAHVGVRDGADLLAVDHQVPAAVTGGGGGRLRAARFAAAHHDDVAALFAADFEDLAPNLVVGNRVLGPARVTNDL